MKLRRPDGAFYISLVLHVVGGAALLWLLAMPFPFEQWLSEHRDTPIERVTFLQVPNHGVTRAGRNGGDNKPKTRTRRPRPVVAPTTTPTAVPPPSKEPPEPEGGTGPVVGTGGAVAGVTPSFSDPRVWLPPGPVMGAPKTQAQRLDSALLAALQPHLDSMAAADAAKGKAPGDWTFGKGGGKWGVDPRNIYIAGHAIPTAILALLPLNQGANPITTGENKALAYQREMIMENAQRAMNEEEFREAVKRIRERKQREHDAEMAERQRRRQSAGADSIAIQP